MVDPQRVAGHFHFGRTLLLLAADVHQGDPRRFDTEHKPGVDVAHDAVLGKVMRLGFEVGAGVDQYDRPAEGRHGDGDARPVDPRQPAHVHLGGGDTRAGVSGGYHRVERLGGLAAGHLGEDDEGGVLLGSHRLHRWLVHRDDLRGPDDRHPGVIHPAAVDRRFNHGAVADEHKLVGAVELFK